MKKNLPPDPLEQLTRQRIGDRIKLSRMQAGYSLCDLGRRSGVASSTIHKIEKYTMSPTVTTLMKIAKGLGKDLYFYIEEGDDEAPFVVIRNRESMLSAFKYQKSLIRAVSSKFDNCRLEVIQSVIDRGGTSGKEELVHKSEEVGLCLKGSIEFEINGHRIILETMDSIHILGNTGHRWRNIADDKSEMLFIFCPPVFSSQPVNQLVHWKQRPVHANKNEMSENARSNLSQEKQRKRPYEKRLAGV